MSAAGVLLVATLGFSAAKTVNVSTSAGGTVILPCRIDETGNVPSVEWSKVRGRGEKGAIAFLYRDGCETFEEKDETFHYRTNLIMKELKDGNISLRLSDVRRSDEGTYECKTLQGGPRVVATVELSVDAVSEPKLTVVKAACGGLALQCEADCWSKEPEITFLDVRGNDVVAEVPKSRYDGGRECFIVTMRATVHTAGRVTCRVHKFHMPGDCVKSCIPAVMITVAVSVFVFGALMAIVGYVVWKHKSPNKTKEDRIISDLKSELCAKEEIIRRLTEALNDLRSTPSTVACQHGHATDCRVTIVNSPSKSALNVSKSIYLPPDQRPQNKDLKPAASRNSTLPKTGDLSKNKDLKPAAPRNSTLPKPGDLPQNKDPKPAASRNSTLPKTGDLPQNKDPKPAASRNSTLPKLGDLPQNKDPKPAAFRNSSLPKTGDLPQNKDPKPAASKNSTLPKTGVLPQNKDPKPAGGQNHSSPALLTDDDAVTPRSSSAFPSQGAHIGRTRSLSESQHRSNSAKLQRRYTMSYNNNPFSVLANLREDESEPLL